MQRTTNICILSLNIDKRISQLTELSKLAFKHKPTAICIQDVFSRATEDREETIRSLFPGYNIHTTDDSQPTLATLTDQEEIEVLGVQKYSDNEGMIAILMTRIQQASYHDETVINAYIRPRTTASAVSEALEWVNLQARNMSRIVLVGDINSTAIIWDNQNGRTQLEGTLNNYEILKHARGKVINSWINRMRLICLNEDHRPATYVGHEQHNSAIDIALVGSKSYRKWKQLSVIRLPGHGHSALLVKSSYGRPNKPTNKTTKVIHDLSKISSQHINTIRITLMSLVHQWERLDEDTVHKRMNLVCDNLCAQILTIQSDIAKAISQRKKVASRKQITANKLADTRTQNIIAKLKKLERNKPGRMNTRKRGKLNDRKKKLHKRLINRLLRSLHKNQDKADVWTHWREANNINLTTTNLSIDTKEDIEALAKSKFPRKERDLSTYLKRTTQDQIFINRQEVDIAIEKLKRKRYNTPEGIKMTVFYTVVSQVPELMHEIARMSFYLGIIPRKAEFTKGIIIPKKAPGLFRIVHVSSPIAAFLETIALARLDYKLELNNLICSNQFGFTALRSRHDLIARLLEHSLRQKQWGKSTCVISMDVEGAFDNVDQALLIKKLSKGLNDIHLTTWIASFLAKRKISIKYKNVESQYRTVCQGVPQGSALGPVLWNFSIHDIELEMRTKSKDTLVLKYADDIYMLVPDDNFERIQREINSFVTAIKRLGLNVRPEKCAYMILFERQSIFGHSQKLTINNTELSKTHAMNVLGVRLDNSCRIDKNDTTLTAKLTAIAHTLNKLKRTRLIRYNKDWRTLIDGLIQSRTVANYWPVLLRSNSDVEWISKLVLKTLMLAFEWPENTPSKAIKLILDIREIKTITQRIAASRLCLEAGTSYKYLMNARCELTRTNYRRYINPDTHIRIDPYNEANESHWIDKFWYVLEGGRYTALAKVENGNIEPQLIHSAWYDACPYTNTLVTLTKASTTTELKEITLVINSKCSIIQALNNWANHDYRLILLREHIHKAQWKLITVDGRPHEALKHTVKQHIKSLNIRARAGDLLSNYYEWVRANTDTTASNLNRTPTSTALKTPDTYDYLVKLLANKEFNMNTEMERRSNRTETCRLIEPDHNKWMQLNPAKLDGRTMMLLGGIIKTSGRLAKDGPITYCEYCNHEVTTHKTALQHRLNECEHFNHNRRHTNLIKEIKRITDIAIPM